MERTKTLKLKMQQENLDKTYKQKVCIYEHMYIERMGIRTSKSLMTCGGNCVLDNSTNGVKSWLGLLQPGLLIV